MLRPGVRERYMDIGSLIDTLQRCGGGFIDG
jgi:hypothetical protein